MFRVVNTVSEYIRFVHMCIIVYSRLSNTVSEYIRFVHMCMSVYSGLSNTVPEYIRFVYVCISVYSWLSNTVSEYIRFVHMCISVYSGLSNTVSECIRFVHVSIRVYSVLSNTVPYVLLGLCIFRVVQHCSRVYQVCATKDISALQICSVGWSINYDWLVKMRNHFSHPFHTKFWLNHYIAEIYFIMNRAHIHFSFYSIAKDDSDIHRFPFTVSYRIVGVFSILLVLVVSWFFLSRNIYYGLFSQHGNGTVQRMGPAQKKTIVFFLFWVLKLGEFI